MLLQPLPKSAELALKVLVCLAQSRGRPLRAREVAACVRISPAQAAKTLYFLTWAGLATSRRGARGGFWLVRAPERIRLRQVIKLFQTPSQKRAAASTDPLLQTWRRIAGPAQQPWETLTLAHLVRRTIADKEASPFVCPDTRDRIYAP